MEAGLYGAYGNYMQRGYLTRRGFRRMLLYVRVRAISNVGNC